MPTYRDQTVRVALAVCSIALAVRTFAPGALTASALATVALPSATVLLMVVMEMLLATPPLSDEPKAVVAAASTSAAPAELASESAIRSVKVLFASQTGTAKIFAEQAARRFADGGIPATSMNLYEYDPLDLQFERGLVIFVLSTWTGGVPPAAARPFFEWIVDTTHDFRSPKSLLVGLQCAVFGLGNSLYADKGHHAKAGRDLEEMLKRLGAHAIVPVGVGDDMEDQDAQFQTWLDGPLQQLVKEPSAAASAAAKEAAGRKRNGRPKSSVSRFDGAKKKPLRQYRREKRAAREKAEAAARHAERQQKRAEASKAAGGGDAIPAAYAGLDADDDDDAEDRINALYLREEEESFKATEAKRVEAAAIAAVGAKVVRGAIGDVESDEEEVDAKTASKQAHNARGAAGGGGGDGIEDLEDLGFGLVVTSTASKTSQPAFKVEGEVVGMVTPKQDRALKKEGYHIIGTHSAVKLCRWTKNQLRGRGGCYKHTCYGITSYQCMEATPSLACANKCVFCWRHHKNPVGREWRWKTDEPDMIVNEAIAEHVRMMLTLRGMPGVQPARLLEAQTVRHCALSLVGEPIMYPHINRLCRLLHEKNISTFLVTNAQFPDAIANLTPVTQLYVSIDAATPKSLKAVDRPLFADYWERFINSLRMLREKKQRTTYRLTLVKVRVDSGAMLV